MKENILANYWNEFLVNPHLVLDRLYEKFEETTIDEFNDLIIKQFKILLNEEDKYQSIPFINNNNLDLHNLKNRSLVRYTCMIQDMFNSEIFFSEITTRKKKYINLYKDYMKDDAEVYYDFEKDCNEDNIEFKMNNFFDRYVYYVISIPGINCWVDELWSTKNKFILSQNLKVEYKDNFINKILLNKKQNYNQTEQENKKEQKETFVLNFQNPIVEEKNKNKPFILKVYNIKEGDFKINSLIEVIGIIEFNESFPEKKQNEIVKNKTEDKNKEFDKQENELQTKMFSLDLDIEEHNNYPYSILPRLHALYIKELPNLDLIKNNWQKKLKELSFIRNEIITFFESFLFGDNLAAEYLLCWFISKVYKTEDILPIGNFPINLSNLYKLSNIQLPVYVKLFSKVVDNLCPYSHTLPLSKNNLNSLFLNPYKDKKSTKLQTGLLQLPKGFSLIIDETALEEGILQKNGMLNIHNLKELIKWQIVEYDHIYFKQKINTDIKVLVLSEGTSLLQIDNELKLQFVNEVDLDQVEKSVTNFLNNKEKLNKIRSYVEYVKNLDHEIPEFLKNKIQDDFVEMRKNSTKKNKIGSDDLHKIISLARLQALSLGERIITEHVWDKAKQMEIQRRDRIK